MYQPESLMLKDLSIAAEVTASCRFDLSYTDLYMAPCKVATLDHRQESAFGTGSSRLRCLGAWFIGPLLNIVKKLMAQTPCTFGG